MKIKIKLILQLLINLKSMMLNHLTSSKPTTLFARYRFLNWRRVLSNSNRLCHCPPRQPWLRLIWISWENISWNSKRDSGNRIYYGSRLKKPEFLGLLALVEAKKTTRSHSILQVREQEKWAPPRDWRSTQPSCWKHFLRSLKWTLPRCLSIATIWTGLRSLSFRADIRILLWIRVVRGKHFSKA